MSETSTNFPIESLYIHVPFCVKKCPYCDFFSLERGEKFFEDYTNTIISEIKNLDTSNKFSTIYIGGGTPTALPSFLLCEILHETKNFCRDDAEITVEANPGTVDKKYLSALKSAGANRLSLGLQTTHAHLLRKIGRIHSLRDFAKNFENAREVGFENINVDLMFALPEQTCDEWDETLAQVISFAPEHISAYALTLSRETKWALSDDETDRKMYHATRRILGDAGYFHYEISNFARAGKESRHNTNCWTMRPYVGVGAGAHSFDGAARWKNTEDISRYVAFFRGLPTLGFDENTKKRSQISSCKKFLSQENCEEKNLPNDENTKKCSSISPRKKFPSQENCAEKNSAQKNIVEEKISLSDADLLAEKIILGLRLTRGVHEKYFSAFAAETEKLIASGLLQRKKNRFCLTERGLDFANVVFAEFI